MTVRTRSLPVLWVLGLVLLGDVYFAKNDYTKAAVYHQFKSKDDVVIAVAETELAALQDALDAAEEEPDQVTARDVLLNRVVDMAVSRRQLTGVLQFDPVVVRLLAEHQPFARFIERLYQVLLGGGVGVEARVNAAVMSAGFSTCLRRDGWSLPRRPPGRCR